jgi:hypothetical protein
VEEINQKLKDAKMADVPRRALVRRLQKPFSDPDWEVARKELEAAGIKLPATREDAKQDQAKTAAAAAAAAASAAAQAGAGTTPGPQPEVGGRSGTEPPPPSDKVPKPTDTQSQYTEPTAEDIEKIKHILKSAGSSFPPEVVIEPLLAGPSHPGFSQKLNYLRYKGINTRKWIPMAPNRTMYRLDDGTIDQCMSVIDDMRNLRKDVKATLIESLDSSHETLPA